MRDPNDVLLEAVMGAYRWIERLALVSLASSVWLLIVSGINPTLSGDKPVSKVELPLGLGADLPAVGLALIALAGYVVSGVLMLFYYRGLQKALERLRQKSPELFEAASVFPSLATLLPAPRLVLFLALGGLGILAICLLYRTPDDFLKGFSAELLLASPYLFLFGFGFWDGVRANVAARHDAANPRPDR
jgi:hypothetical protein